MGEYVTLVGAEQVQRAANEMRSAAETMRQSASNLDAVLSGHQRFLDDWLMRFEQALERHHEVMSTQGERRHD